MSLSTCIIATTINDINFISFRQTKINLILIRRFLRTILTLKVLANIQQQKVNKQLQKIIFIPTVLAP